MSFQEARQQMSPTVDAFADNAFLLRMRFVSAHIFHDLWMNIYPASAQRPGNIVAFSSISYNISKYHSLLLCPQIPRYVLWVFDVNAREIFSLRFQQTSLFEPHNTKYIILISLEKYGRLFPLSAFYICSLTCTCWSPDALHCSKVSHEATGSTEAGVNVGVPQLLLSFSWTKDAFRICIIFFQPCVCGERGRHHRSQMTRHIRGAPRCLSLPLVFLPVWSVLTHRAIRRGKKTNCTAISRAKLPIVTLRVCETKCVTTHCCWHSVMSTWDQTVNHPQHLGITEFIHSIIIIILEFYYG